MNTNITTAARRISRTVNDTPAAITKAFDTNGHEVDAHSTGLTYVNANDEPTHAVKFAGRRGRTPLTWREAQDHLDAAKLYPGDANSQTMHILDAAAARADR